MDMQQKRFLVIVGVLVLLAVSLVAAFLFFTRDTPGESMPTTVDISVEDQELIEHFSKEFIKVDGTWGLKTSVINEENIINAAYFIGENNPRVSEYWYSRVDNYKEMREKYIAKDGSKWYSDSTILNWFDSLARDSLANFKVTAVEAEVPERGSYVTINDTRYIAATVPVKFTSKQTRYTQTVNDSSWDGTFAIEEKIFTDTITLVVVKIGDNWQAYDVRGGSYPFLLSTWELAGQDYYEYQFGFEKIGELKASE